MDLKEDEEAKQVDGYPNYWITTRGRVWSRRRQGSRGGWINLTTSPYGYAVTNLSNSEERRVYLVHRLVAEAFIPNPEGLPYVLHGDGNPANNCIENLRWGTQADNMADMVLHGNSTRGVRCSNAKLTPDDVRAIRVDSRVYRLIAEDYGISQANISTIKSRRSWKHVD